MGTLSAIGWAGAGWLALGGAVADPIMWQRRHLIRLSIAALALRPRAVLQTDHDGGLLSRSHATRHNGNRPPFNGGTNLPTTNSLRPVEVTVEWGYFNYSCPMALRTWGRIEAGAKVVRKEPYWYEGKRHVGIWYFNYAGRGSLLVTDNDDGDCFIGTLDEAYITLGGEPVRLMLTGDVGPGTISRERAAEIAGADALAHGLGVGVRSVVMPHEITWRRPLPYGVALGRSWIAYIAQDAALALRSSTIVVVDRENGDVVYRGTAHDEG